MRNALGTVRSVLLLGGRSEIGLAIVERLVGDGTRIVVLGTRDGEVPETSLSALRNAGATVVETVKFDVTKPRTHRKLFRDTATRIGDIDVVIDAAGVLGTNAEYEADPYLAAQSVTTNFTGHVSAGLAAAEMLRTQGHGTLIVLSSVAGVRVRKANYIYGSAKAGLDGFAQGLGDSLEGTGVRVLLVRPGFVRTQMTEGMPDGPFPVGPDEVAVAVVDGLRNGREVVWVPAKLQPIFAALRLLPRTIWRRLPR